MTEYSSPISLWQLARILSPRRWAAYNRAFDIKPANLGLGTQQRAYDAVRHDRRNRKLDEFQLARKEKFFMLERAQYLRKWAQLDLLTWLEERVKKELNSGKYIITGIDSSNTRQIIDAHDLPTLSLEFSVGGNGLYSENRRFSDVSVQKNQTIRLSKVERGGRKPGQPAARDLWKDTHDILINADPTIFHSKGRSGRVNVSAVAKILKAKPRWEEYSEKYLQDLIRPDCNRWAQER
jgi:hypothetical protein